jgi:peptide/nickel transport system substrate-binding protein
LRTSRSLAGVALAGTLALTGCSGGGSSSHAASPPSQVVVTLPMSEPPGSMADGPATIRGAAKGGTVTVLTHDGLRGTLDPTTASAPDVVSLLGGLVTRSLTQYRYDPRSRQMLLVPDLATALGGHNEHYTKWLFTLRHGARFENGSRVTTADVVRGFRRCLHHRALPMNPCPPTGLRSVSVRRHHEVLFRFARPFPDLPYLVASPAFGPIPARAVAHPSAYAEHPLATGPYRVQRYRSGHRLVLVRNQQWDPATDPVRTQYPDRYVVRAGLSRAHIEHLLVADQGSAQTTLTFDTERPGPFQRSGSDDRLARGPSPCTTYLAPDNRTITDPAVRRALLWAFPYRAVLRAEGLVPDVTAIPATNLTPPGIPGRTAYPVRSHAPFATQPKVARRMLARAHALGTPVRLSLASGTPSRVRVREALVRALRASGFDPRSAGLPVDLRMSTRCGAWPTGYQWVDAVYRSADNIEGFSQPAVDRALRGIAGLPLAQSDEAWNRLDHTVLRRWSPIVPLWYAGVAMAHGSQIMGMADDTVDAMPTWQRLWVSP